MVLIYLSVSHRQFTLIHFWRLYWIENDIPRASKQNGGRFYKRNYDTNKSINPFEEKHLDNEIYFYQLKNENKSQMKPITVMVAED